MFVNLYVTNVFKNLFFTLQKCQDGGAAAARGSRPLSVQVLLGRRRLLLLVGLRHRRLRLRDPDVVWRAGPQEAAGVHLPKLPEEPGRLKV